MDIRKFSHSIASAAAAAAIMAVFSCGEERFHVNGAITGAKDSVIYFEQMGLDGVVRLDSATLGESGEFSFEGGRSDAPEFYRLRIAGGIINLSIDSTETVSVKASYPTMSSDYEISGSESCAKIKELALRQMRLQSSVSSIAAAPSLSAREAEDSIAKVIEAYKNAVKTEYIYKEPMKPYAYFALFQTIRIGYSSALIFNPRNSEEDVKAFAAVATSWDAFHPGAERGQNLHNIAIEGMKNVRIIRNRQNATIDASKVNTSGVVEISLADNKGAERRLSSLTGKVVLLDFHLFAGEGSTKRIMTLRELYNKYHAQGLEIYQVSVDGDEHFWKTQTAALPWISVRAGDDAGAVLSGYNVQTIPTFFLLDKAANVYKRDVQIKDIDAEIKSLL